MAEVRTVTHQMLLDAMVVARSQVDFGSPKQYAAATWAALAPPPADPLHGTEHMTDSEFMDVMGEGRSPADPSVRTADGVPCVACDMGGAVTQGQHTYRGECRYATPATREYAPDMDFDEVTENIERMGVPNRPKTKAARSLFDDEELHADDCSAIQWRDAHPLLGGQVPVLAGGKPCNCALASLVEVEAEARQAPDHLDRLAAFIDAAFDKYLPGSHPDLAQAIAESVAAAQSASAGEGERG